MAQSHFKLLNILITDGITAGLSQTRFMGSQSQEPPAAIRPAVTSTATELKTNTPSQSHSQPCHDAPGLRTLPTKPLRPRTLRWRASPGQLHCLRLTRQQHPGVCRRPLRLPRAHPPAQRPQGFRLLRLCRESAALTRAGLYYGHFLHPRLLRPPRHMQLHRANHHRIASNRHWQHQRKPLRSRCLLRHASPRCRFW